jgi:hypothetical protein
MTPQFLREEAARFRGMAEMQEREASKVRLLKMAVDYEAQANAADEPTDPASGEPVKVKAAKKAAGSVLD